MIIYPAIDILKGNCVRLYQGNYAKETIYHDSPVEIAQEFLEKGATWLHLVDLDAAKSPDSTQAILIKELLRVLPINIQVGGGIRTEDQISRYLDAGAQRVVIGSQAIESPELVEQWLLRYGAEHIVLAFDVLFKTGIPIVMTQAWQKATGISLFEVLQSFSNFNAKHILCTDISKDGVLNGPNIDLYREIKSLFPELHIQASGGIHSLADLRNLRHVQVAGAITGRALYEKKFDLSEALLC